MMIVLFNILLFLQPAFDPPQDLADGIYLEIEAENCSHQIAKQLNTKTELCISENPVIGWTDFKAVGKLIIHEAKQTQEFSIILTLEGKKRLTSLSKVYSGKNVALVLDEEVVCLMKVFGTITSGKITVTEKLSQTSLQAIHEKLKIRLAQ